MTWFRFLSLTLVFASPCQDDLRVVQGAHTPSRLFLAGESFVSRVLSSAPPGPILTATSVWLEFTRDQRYDGELGLETDALQLALGGPERYRQQTVHLRRIASVADAPPPHFIVTWRTLGVRSINRLIDRRVYPAGLVESARVDGAVHDREKFIEHDLAHALAVESLLYGKNRDVSNRRANRIKLFHRHLRYPESTAGLEPRDHLLFDVGYFLYFHEFMRCEVWDNAYGSVFESKWRKTQLQFAYGRNSRFEFAFSPGDELTVRMTADTTRMLINRFLNPGDLYVNLPLEIKALIRERPESSVAVLTAWLNEAFLVFFRAHYGVAKRELGIAG